MQSKEEYIGGFYSQHMEKHARKLYGIYATNQRIIGLEFGWFEGRGFPDGSLLSSAPEVTLMTRRSLIIVQERKVTKEEADKIIAWLDQRKKDFELNKEQISQIEIKKLGLVHSGYFRVTSTSGKRLRFR
jgi:hypothetical protein